LCIFIVIYYSPAENSYLNALCEEAIEHYWDTSYNIIFLLSHVKNYNRRDKDNIFSFLKDNALFLYPHELQEVLLQEVQPADAAVPAKGLSVPVEQKTENFFFTF